MSNFSSPSINSSAATASNFQRRGFLSTVLRKFELVRASKFWAPSLHQLLLKSSSFFLSRAQQSSNFTLSPLLPSCRLLNKLLFSLLEPNIFLLSPIATDCANRWREPNFGPGPQSPSLGSFPALTEIFLTNQKVLNWGSLFEVSLSFLSKADGLCRLRIELGEGRKAPDEELLIEVNWKNLSSFLEEIQTHQTH